MNQPETPLPYPELLNVLERSTELLTEMPVDQELFSADRLENYASQLASHLHIAEKLKRRGRSLRPELKKNGHKLESAYLALAKVIQSKHSVSPAVEWFVDNFHVIESQLREIKQNLPDNYYYGLPQIKGGNLDGFPRVYAIAVAIVAHSDSRLDITALQRFLVAFQKVSPLQIGELWALVITLRIVLVQHLTVLAVRLVSSRDNCEKADVLAERLLPYATKPGVGEKEIAQFMSKELGAAKTFNRPFIVQLIQRLRDQDPEVWPAFDWLEHQLSKLSTTTHRVTQLELHRQAANQVTIGNILGSMRLLSATDWREFVEGVNLVDPVLARDPHGSYREMDFATRDQYRHAIEQIAKRSDQSEVEAAERAIGACQGSSRTSRHNHVGFHLIGEGRAAFEKACGYRPILRERLLNAALRHPSLVYLGASLVFTLIFMAPVIYYYWQFEHAVAAIVAFGLLALLPASELALSFVNHYITYFFKPATLPRMDTEHGIPGDVTTMVVIPTLFTRQSVVRNLVERLEIHALANPDPTLNFGLLGDFADAPSETMPEDDSLLRYAQESISALNERHCAGQPARFHLFLRKRLWNPSEGAWLGWERKRGKLHEFNRLLRGDSTTSYVVSTAPPSLLGQIRYVITLDSDTQLPRDAARKLVGTIMHPLNQPHFDVRLGRVTSGYGILQPRISITGESALATRFARISSGNIGLDPYTTAVSDVYQDLFREGSFTGKGLYVVDAFEQALKDRVPENRILSHDLFEGSFARSALVTDVELFDDYPADYDTFSKRQHRWTRGDWQNISWIFPRVRDANSKKVSNVLSAISRWKIFDNLRRSLVPVATLIWLVLAWTVLPGSASLWTLLIVLMYLFPVYSTVATGDWMRKRGVTWQGHFLGGWRESKIKFGQILLTIAFLPQQAWSQVDAIARVGYRLLVSGKKRLEWMTYAQLSSRSGGDTTLLGKIDSGPILALLIGTAVSVFRPSALPIAAFFLALWISNPLLKSWLNSRPLPRKRPLKASELRDLRSYARSTWRFFETFVTAEDNWLAPDNFQEDPKPVVAHRTSPTNIGLQLLANASAYDLGYVGHLQVIENLEKTFETLSKLQKMHGHFFNWYDTLTLEPLHPRYISTVDSGNLAGHLLALKQFLVEIRLGGRSIEQMRRGLEDTFFHLFEEVSRPQDHAPATGAATVLQVQEILDSLLNRLRESTVATSDSALDEWPRTLKSLETHLLEARDILEALSSDTGKSHQGYSLSREWMNSAILQVQEFTRDLKPAPADLLQRQSALISACDEMVRSMDFRFLYDSRRKLFVIGFNVDDNRRDGSCYDLLASESRLTSFIAIAKGDVNQEHWFRLGRRMAPVKGGRALIAWTATMFEYLMPLLVMRRHEDTLLDQTYKAVVQRQIEYGQKNGVPWGVSESGYNARDLQMNFQYGPFGIPGLGLKRGLSDDLVVSPYSTMLAALIDPHAALLNLHRLVRLGAFARFGFYEAIDYTTERLPGKQKFVILRSFMAHHQGMSLVALNNVLNNFIMHKRFHTDPFVQATELLLQERIPQSVTLSQPRSEEIPVSGFLHSSTIPNPRLYSDINHSIPRTQILSNDTYSVMVTSTGAGYSRCGPLAITRWREDATRDNWGQFYYICDRSSGAFWSAAHQPTAKVPDNFGATFSEEKVEFWRKDEVWLTHTEILVSTEDNVELRRISLTNESDSAREIEVTSFMETVLAKPADDAAHPAFSNLFVQTESVVNGTALLATRRPRSNNENPPWGFHVVSTDAPATGVVQFETDRSRFIGRGRNVSEPLVIAENRPLSNTVGSVLDPIFALRQPLKIEAGESVSITFATGLATSREEALSLIDRYRDIHIFQRESEIAWTQAQVQLRHLNISNAKAHVYQRLAGRVLYLDSSLRPSSHALVQNTRAQSNLWAYGISGDLPIILTQLSEEKDLPMVRELLHAHEYLRLKGISIDLVILNERAPSYLQTLQEEIQRQIRMSGSHGLLDKPGGIFLRRTDLIPREDVTLLRTVARVILSADKGSLNEQLKHRKPRAERPAKFEPVPSLLPRKSFAEPATPLPELQFFNGLGGFSSDAKEYVIILKEGQWTPAPWINVIANSKDFGFIISESGSGYTWATNSRENRLTPWSNDPISDPPGEAIYLRDEETGEFWSPTPLPVREREAYVIRHGQGYTRFEHTSHGIEQCLDVFVALDSCVKLSRLKLKNTGTVARSLSVTSYAEWVLGFQRSTTSAFVIPEHDEVTGALLARNPYNNEFAAKVAFADISSIERTFTCDRREFLGRNGSPSHPAALSRVGLSNSSGAGLDPCAALQTKISLEPGEEKTIVMVLGEADNVEAARHTILRFRDLQVVDQALVDSKAYWDETLSAVEIETPDLAMNTLVNRWLIYQTLSCRVWARSAFYQSGGAFGFRDQLQDVMAVIYSHPEIARAQILTAAARQFREGDVQHWWHPPTGRGVRTHFSDDLLWLPFVVSHYTKITGDMSILDDVVPFIEAPLLAPGQDDAYTHPQLADETGSIFEHCARALDRSLKVGSHGLPLMGAGDWNDGMNRVGHEGRGESVWVAWFLFSALTQFIPLCERNGQSERACAYKQHLQDLKKAIEENAWDGDWYRRAYFDDGTPLGSAANEECRIDSISQSWAVLSGAGDPARAARAMAAVDEYLIHRGDGLVKLFTPPFDKTLLDPGYIKGYVPGVRENGGQYTHAAIWTLMAFAELGDGDRAAELYALLNPINHSSTRSGLHKYKVEPYVVAADIYGLHPHVGRGGWTWYTGSASWMYRAALESILGFDLKGNSFRVRPKVPGSWTEFIIRLRRGSTRFKITLKRSTDSGESLVALVDGQPVTGEWIELTEDGKEHDVQIRFHDQNPRI